MTTIAMQSDDAAKATLRECAEQALMHLERPDADVATIAKQMKDTAALTLAEVEPKRD